MKAALAERPQLIHWVARTDDIDARGRARCPTLGVVTPMTRGDFAGASRFPTTATGPARGLVPTLIQWDVTRAIRPTRCRIRDCARGARRRASGARAGARARSRRSASSDALKVTYAQVAAARGDDPHAARRGDALSARRTRRSSARGTACEPSANASAVVSTHRRERRARSLRPRPSTTTFMIMPPTIAPYRRILASTMPPTAARMPAVITIATTMPALFTASSAIAM